MSPTRATAIAVALASTLTLSACGTVPPQPPAQSGVASRVTAPAAPSPTASASPTASTSPSTPVSPSTTPSGTPPVSATPFPVPKEGYSQSKTLKDRRTPAGAGVPGGPNTTDRIVLTYDDCPHSMKAFKDTVLGAEALGVRFVVFTLGTCVKSGSIDVDFARQHGMFVYGHSFNHPSFSASSDAKIRAQLKPPSVQGAWMRPPYGAATPRVERVVNEAGMKLWQWNLDTQDWTKLSRDQVVYSVVTESQPGDTVLMHLGWNGFSAEAIRAMKDGLATRGLELCRNTGPVAADSEFSC